ncbi:MAG TPA: acyltransferase [Fimbriimonadaceae bacterium]|nr:acyltransferase [Fimbriimonadaceae bacterium]
MRRRAGRRASSSPHERLAFIEGLRGVAALYVVFTHFGSMIDPSHLAGTRSKVPDWMQSILHPLWYGHLAVAAFIVLSGYCLQTSLFGGKDGRIHNFGKFYARRARRILPPYYATLVISVIVSIYITSKHPVMPFSQYIPVTKTNVLAHVFMAQNFQPDWMYKLNGVLWSISIEWQLYLLFPVLVWLLFKVGRFAHVIITSLVAIALLLLIPEAIKLYVWYIPLFALGMAASHLAYRPNARVGILPRLSAYVFVIAAAACGYACYLEGGVHPGMLPICDAWIGLAVAALVYLGTVAPWTPFTKLFAWKPIADLGFFSYSLYLMHHPILQVLYFYRPAWIQGPEMLAVYMVVACLPIILVTCYTFSRLFEMPFMATKKSRAPSQREMGTPVALPLVSGMAIVQTEKAVRAEALAQSTLAAAEKAPAPAVGV